MVKGLILIGLGIFALVEIAKQFPSGNSTTANPTTTVHPLTNASGTTVEYQIPGTSANPAGGIVSATPNPSNPYSMLPFL